MSATIKRYTTQDTINAVKQSILEHPAWLGPITGLKAEKLLRQEARQPYEFVLRSGEAPCNYYVTFMLPDLSVKHQPFLITVNEDGWYSENIGRRGPFNEETIEDVLHLIMHCQKDACSVLQTIRK